MSKEQLKLLRIFVPGAMIFVALLPFLHGGLDLSSILTSLLSAEGLVYSAVIFVLGALYYIVSIRDLFFAGPIRQIQDNIKRKLIHPYITDPMITAGYDKAISGRGLIMIFYHFVDADASLKEKAKNVYLNGLMLSSTADLMSISLISGTLYGVVYLWSKNQSFLILAASLFLVHILATHLLLPRITRQHIERSDEQLDHIAIHHRVDLRQKILDLIRN